MADLPANLVLPKIVHARCQIGGGRGSYVDREYVLQYCEKGAVDFRLEARVYRLDAGTALLMPPHLPHASCAIRDADQQYVIVHFKLPTESTLLQSFPLAVKFGRAEAARLSERLHVLLSEWGARRPGYDLIVSGILIEVLGMIWRNNAADVKPTPHASKAWRNIERVKPWMHQHTRETLSIDAMSYRAGLSPAYFCKAFKEYTGRSPHNYLNGIRVENARQLLCNADLNCTEVGDRVGFTSVAAFSKVFRKIVGVSPSKWVEQYLSRLS
jgi:AraC-like DNA-binding protein